MPQFSVIIPAYNRQHLIAATLACVLRQTWQDFEIIVVDDGSTDGTARMAAEQGPGIRVLRQANAGPGAARNRGIDEARGRYVAFLDSDDLWFPWTLETYAKAISESQDPAFLMGDAVEFREDSELGRKTRGPMIVKRYADYLAASAEAHWVGCSVAVVRTDVLQTSGGFNPAKVNQEDCDLWLRLGAAPGFALVTSPVCCARRRHAGNVSHEVQRNVEGVRHLVRQYRAGRYPTDGRHGRQCLEVLTRHIRPACLDCLKTGQADEAWRLYRQSLGWHLRLGRYAFLLGFPVMAQRQARRQRSQARG